MSIQPEVGRDQLFSSIFSTFRGVPIGFYEHILSPNDAFNLAHALFRVTKGGMLAMLPALHPAFVAFKALTWAKWVANNAGVAPGLSTTVVQAFMA